MAYSPGAALAPGRHRAVEALAVRARQFPVTVHFARRTELARPLDAVFEKVSDVHRRLPKGGILVFLAGKREIDAFCARLRERFGRAAGGAGPGRGPGPAAADAASAGSSSNMSELGPISHAATSAPAAAAADVANAGSSDSEDSTMPELEPRCLPNITL